MRGEKDFYKDLRKFINEDDNAKFIVNELYEHLCICGLGESLSMLESAYIEYRERKTKLWETEI